MDALPDHIGCVVKQLEDSCASYTNLLGLNRRTRPFEVASQHVRVCFIELRHGFYLELITPLDNRANLARFLDIGFYHLCFLVEDLIAAREQLTSNKFAALPAFQSEAFAGNTCQFFFTLQTHLIELAEMSTINFGEFFEANLVASDPK